MTEQNNENKLNIKTGSENKENVAGECDPGLKSLSGALRFSFITLKAIMLLFVIIFLASGFRVIEPYEQALVLRFGKIRGKGEQRVLGSGPKLRLPYPIHEIVKIPVAKKVNLPIDSFWYYQTPKEMLGQGPKDMTRVPEALNPVREGYCITQSSKQGEQFTALQGSDYNIVHSKWQLTYQITDPERFFKNVYIEDIMPGQVYFEIIKKSVKPLLTNLSEDAIVDTMVHYTIDEAILSKERIPQEVKRRLQDKLDEIECGISVSSLQLVDITWPRQVDAAFWASTKAIQDKKKTIAHAHTDADELLNQTAGAVTRQLYDTVKDENISLAQKEILWARAAGKARGKIAQAKAYRTKVVETASANAEYLQKILPEYRKRPKLVLQKIYQDAMEYIFDNTDEKMILQPTKGTKGTEIRIMLNRDPLIKSKSKKNRK